MSGVTHRVIIHKKKIKKKICFTFYEFQFRIFQLVVKGLKGEEFPLTVTVHSLFYCNCKHFTLFRVENHFIGNRPLIKPVNIILQS